MPLPNVSAQSEEQISWVDDVDIYPLESISDTPEVLEAFGMEETGQPSYAESAADDKLRFVVAAAADDAARPTTSLDRLTFRPLVVFRDEHGRQPCRLTVSRTATGDCCR